MTGNGHVRFGGGPPQKYRPDEGRQLGGGLPNFPLGTWLDNTSEALAGILRPGNAGAN